MRLLLCLLLLLPACSPDSEDDCAEAQAASEKQAAVIDDIRSQREKAGGQGSDANAAGPGVLADLEARDRAETRLLSQILVGSPDCFPVDAVARAREYLDQSD